MSEYSSDKIISILKDVFVSFSTDQYDSFSSQLSGVGELVKSTGASDQYRSQVGKNTEIWGEIKNILQQSNVLPSDEDDLNKYVRLYRGVLLFVRNIIMYCDNQSDEIVSSLINDLDTFVHGFPPRNEFYTKTVVVYFEILANLPKFQWEQESNNKAIIEQINLILSVLNLSDYQVPLIHFVVNVFLSEKRDETHHNLNLYNLLKIEKDNAICDFLVLQFHGIENFESLSPTQNRLVEVLYELITHESFGKWLTAQKDSVHFIDWLKLNQLLITSKEDWNNYELISLMSWTYDFFGTYSEASIESILNESWEKDIQTITIIVLDILSDLSKYEQAKQFLQHYDIITQLIKFLRVVHENIQPITIKHREKKIIELKQEQFPQVKSLIIEVIAYLCHESFETQEKVRELHGLELVLSNCIIDENNPFVKERSIICLKFLLANNPGNQKFVADLEAKKTYDDEVLKDVGYEVEIENGKVNLKKSA
ncbi:copper transport protein 86 [Scheffersomyces xylosifermentans]|uniref:copper transport protein 86 n=1 Tax=Scheffersomyces xylosifermentans TaxID=1304137 RepID=UPI00315DC0A8